MSDRTLKGRTCVITGANSGIGAVTAQVLAAQGAEMILAGRSKDNTRPVLDSIEIDTGRRPAFVPLDLGSFDSVRRAAGEINAMDRPIDLLINNAGLAGVRDTNAAGFELLFAVNHLGHFLFTQLLLDRVRAADSARIINVSSDAHFTAKGIDWEALRRPAAKLTAMDAYAVSKLSNVLFTKELQRRLEGTGVTAYALHPGVVSTNVWRKIPRPFAALAKLFMIDSQEGAKTTIHCATAPLAELDPGGYYDKCTEKEPSEPARDPALAAELWRRSEQWVSAGKTSDAAD